LITSPDLASLHVATGHAAVALLQIVNGGPGLGFELRFLYDERL
jgi:hypothetical protein